MVEEQQIINSYKKSLLCSLSSIADIGYILPSGEFIDITKDSKGVSTNCIIHGDETLLIQSLQYLNPTKTRFYIDDIANHYGWIEINKKILSHQLCRLSYKEPTEQQYVALKMLIDYCLSNNGFFRVSSLKDNNCYQVYVLFNNKYLEQDYEENFHLTSDFIIRQIKDYYQTGILKSVQRYYSDTDKRRIRVK